MKEITFSFNKKARDQANRALDRMIALVSPTSLLFSIFLKEMHDRIAVAVASFIFTGIFFLIKVIIHCFEDESKKPASKRAKSADDTS